MGYQTRSIVLLLLLLLHVELSLGRVSAAMEGMSLANRQSNQASAQMKMMRNLIMVDAMLDYDKDPGANTKHEPPPQPPKNGKSGGSAGGMSGTNH